jgi:hypothetical protein
MYVRLKRAPDGFRFLAGLALRRFFIRPAAFHLTKNALALHLLFEDPESLIDIVVASEYLQNVFQSAVGAACAVQLNHHSARRAELAAPLIGLFGFELQGPCTSFTSWCASKRNP